MNRELINRQRGCLYGLAVGDALGAAVEFKRPGTFEPVTGYRDGGPHRLKPGQWTDDTSMALAMADAIGRNGGWDLGAQCDNYLRWTRRGEFSVNGECFDIGITTSASLKRYQTTGDPFTSGDTSERASGNGSIMRLAPVPIYYAHWFPESVAALCKRCEESSIPTNASQQCRSACRYLGAVLAALVNGQPREEVLSPTWEYLRVIGTLEPKIADVVSGSYRHRQPPAIKGTGWVVDCLESALWAFHNAEDFTDAVFNAVNLGDDADTTGAVCGQLAGAYWGYSGIPDYLIDGLDGRNMIDKALSQLLD